MSAPTYLFLDTEWADEAGKELVSIALVSEDGHRTFYAERDPLPHGATDFVRQVVYPLLDRGLAAMPDAVMTAALRRFLSETDQPTVLADYPNDLALLKVALGGFDCAADELATCGPIPTVVMTVMVREGLTTRLLEEWFSAHPEAAARRHHALVDAGALRVAWLAATGRIEAVWDQRRES